MLDHFRFYAYRNAIIRWATVDCSPSYVNMKLDEWKYACQEYIACSKEIEAVSQNGSSSALSVRILLPKTIRYRLQLDKIAPRNAEIEQTAIPTTGLLKDPKDPSLFPTPKSEPPFTRNKKRQLITRSCETLVPSMLFDMLPQCVVQDAILSFIGDPHCHECGTSVRLLEPMPFPKLTEGALEQPTNGKPPLPPPDDCAIYTIEEVARKHNIHVPQQRKCWILDNHMRHNLVLNHHSNSRSFPIEELASNLDLKEVIAGQNKVRSCGNKIQKPPSGPVYQEKDEDQLLGPFRFCLQKRPVKSFVDFLTCDKNKIFCSRCATAKQERHFEREFVRIRTARNESIEAWIMEKLASSGRRARYNRPPRKGHQGDKTSKLQLRRRPQRRHATGRKH